MNYLNLDMESKTQYTVSVRFMTYNHEAYIREAIEGVLKQQVNFMVEIVIGDDFSTDNTREIISEYQNTSNIHFKILERPIGGEYWTKRQKLGRFYNFQNIIENCNGKYIALLDGDDYWTDPYKLQKQVDFLEQNEQFYLCTHAMNVLKDGVFTPYTKNKNVFVLEDFLFANQVGYATASYMIRNTSFFQKKITSVAFRNTGSGDLIVAIVCLMQGSMFFINEIMGVYRVHDAGVYSQTNWLNKFNNHLKTALTVDDFLDKKYNKQILRFNFKKMFLERPKEVSIDEIYSLYSTLEYNSIRRIVYKWIMKVSLTPKIEVFITKVLFYRF